MNIIKNKKLGDIASLVFDGAAFYVILREAKQFSLFVVDAKSLEIVSDYVFMTEPYKIKPCVDDNFIYVTLKDNSIAIIDKFSGQSTGHIDIGSFIPISDLYHQNDLIYFVAASPVMHGLQAKTDMYCVCCFDKKTRRKIMQSRSSVGSVPSLYFDENAYVCEKNNISIFQNNTLMSDISISLDPNFLLTYSDLLIFGSKDGLIEILNKENYSSVCKTILSSTSAASPVKDSLTQFIWFMDSGIFSFDLTKMITKHIGDLPHRPFGSPIKVNDNFYCLDQKGVLQFNLRQPSDHSLLPESATEIFALDDNLLISTKNSIYEIML